MCVLCYLYFFTCHLPYIYLYHRNNNAGNLLHREIPTQKKINTQLEYDQFGMLTGLQLRYTNSTPYISCSVDSRQVQVHKDFSYIHINNFCFRNIEYFSQYFTRKVNFPRIFPHTHIGIYLLYKYTEIKKTLCIYVCLLCVHF